MKLRLKLAYLVKHTENWLKKQQKILLILLKNKDNILPLDKKKKIAMIGPYIDRRYMLGGWSFTGTGGVITIKSGGRETCRL